MENYLVCESCRAELKLRVAPTAGQRIRCPKCGQVFVAAGEESARIDTEDRFRERQRRRATAPRRNRAVGWIVAAVAACVVGVVATIILALAVTRDDVAIQGERHAEPKKPLLQDDPSLPVLEAADAARLADGREKHRLARQREEQQLLLEWRKLDPQRDSVFNPRGIALLQGGFAHFSEIAFSPDGRFVAAGGDSGANIWELASRRLAHTLRGHGRRVKGIAFSPDGKLLATASNDRAILWEVESGQMRRELAADANAVAFSPDGKILATGGGIPASGRPAPLQLWNVENGELAMSLPEKAGTVQERGLAFSPDGRILAAGTDFPGSVVFWNARTGKRVWTTEVSISIDALAFAPDGAKLAGLINVSIVPRESTLMIWDTESKAARALLEKEFWLNGFAFSPDGKHVAARVSNKSHFKLLEVRTGKTIRHLGGEKSPNMSNILAYSPGGTFLAGEAFGQGVRIWAIEDLLN